MMRLAMRSKMGRGKVENFYRTATSNRIASRSGDHIIEIVGLNELT
jgi:hypothetical protein